MPKILPAVFSYEEMKERWDESNPEEPYTRRPDLQNGIYALDKWVVREDDEGNVIATAGWKEHASHSVLGGILASKRGEKVGGNNRALQDAIEGQLNPSKPVVAAWFHRFGDNKRWIAYNKKNGWIFPDDAEFQKVKKLLPEDVLNAWITRYPDNMAIRTVRSQEEMAKCVYLDDPTPEWFNLLKRN